MASSYSPMPPLYRKIPCSSIIRKNLYSFVITLYGFLIFTDAAPLSVQAAGLVLGSISIDLSRHSCIVILELAYNSYIVNKSPCSVTYNIPSNRVVKCSLYTHKTPKSCSFGLFSECLLTECIIFDAISVTSR